MLVYTSIFDNYGSLLLPQLVRKPKVPLKAPPETKHMAREGAPCGVVPHEETPSPERCPSKLALTLA